MRRWLPLVLASAACFACGKAALEKSPGAASALDGPSFMPGLGPPADAGRAEVGAVTGDAACATSTTRAERVPLDLYLMLDSSYSMLEDAAPGVNKWEAVRSALATFMMDGKSAGLGLGLQYFPVVRPEVPEDCYQDATCGARGPCLIARTCSPGASPRLCDSAADCAAGARCVPLGGCTRSPEFCAEGLPLCPGGPANSCVLIPGYCIERDICEIEPYATPAVPIGELPGSAGALMASLAQKRPEGRTPTGPALAGALRHLQARLAANPARRAAVVLASDGFPVVCSPSTVPAVAALAEAAATATPPVLTFAVGVVAAGEAPAATRNLGAIATAGGTSRPYVINTGPEVTGAFLEALARIRTRALTCEYKLPTPSSGTLDYSRINVQFTGGNGQVTSIANVPDRDACDPARGGWYYDLPPGTGSSPTSVVICPPAASPCRPTTGARSTSCWAAARSSSTERRSASPAPAAPGNEQAGGERDDQPGAPRAVPGSLQVALAAGINRRGAGGRGRGGGGRGWSGGRGWPSPAGAGGRGWRRGSGVGIDEGEGVGGDVGRGRGGVGRGAVGRRRAVAAAVIRGAAVGWDREHRAAVGHRAVEGRAASGAHTPAHHARAHRLPAAVARFRVDGEATAGSGRVPAAVGVVAGSDVDAGGPFHPGHEGMNQRVDGGGVAAGRAPAGRPEYTPSPVGELDVGRAARVAVAGAGGGVSEEDVVAHDPVDGNVDRVFRPGRVGGAAQPAVPHQGRLLPRLEDVGLAAEQDRDDRHVRDRLGQHAETKVTANPAAGAAETPLDVHPAHDVLT